MVVSGLEADWADVDEDWSNQCSPLAVFLSSWGSGLLHFAALAEIQS